MVHRTAALLALLVLVGCGSTQADTVTPDKLRLGAGQEPLRALYQQAVKAGETQVVVYGPNQTNYAAINEAFGKRFPGITVKGEPYTGAALESRLATEFSSRKHVADLIENTTYNYLDKGYYQPYSPPTADRLDATFREKTGHLWGVSGTLFGFQYNTDKVPQPPASWHDLIDPKWKGQIASGDPGQPSATSDMLIKLQAAGVIDDAWLRGLAANKLAVKSELELAAAANARGEYGIVLVQIYNFFAKDKAKGAPVQFVFPSDGVMVAPNFYGVVKDAPHPAAAKLFMSWLFTPEAQDAFAKAGVYPLMPGAKTADGIPPTDQLKVVNAPDPAEMTKLWTPGTKKLKDILGGS
ncbi:MAG: extracellular solute-binding protein [Nonomuraea sp.]|nr:extracellular solute-binding protein [Nonomuraea sp.]